LRWHFRFDQVFNGSTLGEDRLKLLDRTDPSGVAECCAQGLESIDVADQDVAGSILAAYALVDQCLCDVDDVPQGSLLLDDADITGHIRKTRQAIIERHEVAEAAASVELIKFHQFIGDSDAVNALVPLL